MLRNLERLLRLTRGFFTAIVASDFTERFRSMLRSRLKNIGGLCSFWKCWFLLVRSGPSLIARGENLRALEIFVRVDMSFFFLGGGFARFFLTGGFGDVLRLRECGMGNETNYERRGEEQASARGGPPDWAKTEHRLPMRLLGPGTGLAR
jgi:hypothetical protein